jgi:N-acetylmuramoyl-L-alanine amidase
MRVCLDPGHGGYDPGACGNGLQEKDITLEIALQLSPLLVYNGIGVGLTRTGDYAPNHLEDNLNGELNARVSISDSYGADLFVSIHVNSGGGTGQEVLISGAGGKAESAANLVYNQINKVTGWANRGVKVQNVLVLKETKAPAILTENGFIDSASDSAKLKDSSFIHSLAVAHAKGICDYFGITYKESPQSTVITNSVAPATDKVTQAISLLNQAISILKG